MIYWVRSYEICTTLIILLMAPVVAAAQGSPDQKIVDAAKWCCPLIERKLRASYRSRETRTIEAELVARPSIEGVL